MRQLSQLQETFHKFYVCTAVRKFFFFLDPLRTGRIAIPDILCSGYLDKLLEVSQAINRFSGCRERQRNR
jgi:serine/threonine-protein phosphatase 2A regulatory subunit B''/actin-binding protein anillin